MEIDNEPNLDLKFYSLIRLSLESLFIRPFALPSSHKTIKSNDVKIWKAKIRLCNTNPPPKKKNKDNITTNNFHEYLPPKIHIEKWMKFFRKAEVILGERF